MEAGEGGSGGLTEVATDVDIQVALFDEQALKIGDVLALGPDREVAPEVEWCWQEPLDAEELPLPRRGGDPVQDAVIALVEGLKHLVTEVRHAAPVYQVVRNPQGVDLVRLRKDREHFGVGRPALDVNELTNGDRRLRRILGEQVGVEEESEKGKECEDGFH